MPARGGRQAAGAPSILDRLFVGDLESGAQAVIERAASGEGGYACCADAHVVTTASRDPRVRRALADAWAVFPDGVPVAWLLRRAGRTPARRVYGPDLMGAVFEQGRERGLRHLLFGTTGAVLERLEEELRSRYPGCEIAGSVAPGLVEEGAGLDGATLEAIRAARPHVVWCALGAPKQELWMQRNAAALAPAVVLGVGAAFEFIAGTKPQAPARLQKLGLEWLHRLATEPRRLGPRYRRTIPAFLLLAARELARPSLPDRRRGTSPLQDAGRTSCGEPGSAVHVPLGCAPDAR